MQLFYFIILFHDSRCILSIDIGWLNMGLALAECKSSTDVDIEYVKKVNLDDYKYIYSNE